MVLVELRPGNLRVYKHYAESGSRRLFSGPSNQHKMVEHQTSNFYPSYLRDFDFLSE
jgi:hypothetical protein